MRKMLFVFAAFALMLSAQGNAPKNLQVLKPAEVRASMGAATAGLGVTCAECHAAPDMSSDEKPAKLIARKMFAMTADINSKFPDGKAHVSCYTCHRGQKEPLMVPPAAVQ
jgi:hypothetical protein